MKAAWLTEIAMAASHRTPAQLASIQLLQTWQSSAMSHISADSTQRPPGGMASFRIQGWER